MLSPQVPVLTSWGPGLWQKNLVVCVSRPPSNCRLPQGLLCSPCLEVLPFLLFPSLLSELSPNIISSRKPSLISPPKSDFQCPICLLHSDSESIKSGHEKNDRSFL